MTPSSTVSQSPLVFESSSPRFPSPPIPLQAGWFQRWWVQACRDAGADFKATRWGRGSIWVVFALATLSLFGCLLSFASVIREWHLSGSIDPRSACHPDGSFSANGRFNYWKISGLFQITLSSGSLDFTQAKVVDIVWDLAVGKGGQAVLALYSWKAFSTYVRSAMHTGPITYSSFFAIFLESEASVRSTYRVTRDFTTRRALRSRLAMPCIVGTMMFVLAWPTLASAMTGYTPATRAFVIDVDNNLISFNSFAVVAYVIHDGWRVNHTGNYLVPYMRSIGPDHHDARMIWQDGVIHDVCQLRTGETSVSEASTCSLLETVSAYTKEYGFLALDAAGNLNDIETKWMDRTIEKPALNISAFYISYDNAYYGYYAYYGHTWRDPRTNQTPYANISNVAFMALSGNATYNLKYLEKNGSCQAVDNRFQWGFSFLQLFIVLLLLLIWIVVVYSMWLKGHLDLGQRHGDEAPARFKAVLDLAAALHHGLADIGEPPDGLTNRQLERCISRRLNGGRVAVHTPSSLAAVYSFRKGTWSWIKREKWWFALLIVSLLLPAMLFYYIGLSFFALFSFSVILALAIGRTRGSRLLICLAGLSIALYFMAGFSLIPTK